MNKFKFFTVTALAATITLSIPVIANADSPYCTQSDAYAEDCSFENLEDIQNKLKEYGIDINSLNFGCNSNAGIRQEIQVKFYPQCTDTEVDKEVITSPIKPDEQTEASTDTDVTQPVTSGTTDNSDTVTITDSNTDVITNTDADAQKNTLTYAQQVVKLVNEERAKEGISPLSLDTKVEAAANVRAEETIISFSHTRPNGASFGTALKEQGVSYRMSGENIAYGQKSPEEVMEAWMNSPGHRANILNEKFTTIGVGYYQSANGTNYWSQLFTS